MHDHVSHVRSLAGWSTDLEAHHDHARDPEEEDVQPRLQQRRGIERLIQAVDRWDELKQRPNMLIASRTYAPTFMSAVLSGQPNTEKGKRPEENHVSSTSSSCHSSTCSRGWMDVGSAQHG